MDPNIDWVGIAPLLAGACDQLDVGEMVQSSAFSLFDAMSAVEVGNPKMDAGARPKVQRVPLAERPLPLDLSPQQLLAWMDRLLRLEATWHVGGALAQTVYSCLQMMQLDRLSANPTVSGYCRALHALCQEVNALVLQGCVCEEEDFMCFATGLPLEEPAEPADAVLAALSAAADAYDSRVAKGGDERNARLSAALLCRIHLRKLLYQAVSRLRGRTKQDLDAAAKCLARAATELAAARASAHLGSPHAHGSGSGGGGGGGGGSGGSEDEEEDDAVWAALGFDPGLNAHLAPPAPPRVVKALSRDDAFDYFERLIEQLTRATRITSVSDFYAMESFVTAFSASRPVAVARSALHLQLAQQATLEQAAAAAGAPAAPPPLTPAQQPWAPSAPMLRAATSCLPPGPDLGEDSDMFTEQALIAVGNWAQAALLNPARHRRRLRRGLDDWAHLYQHAVNADCSDAFGSAALAAGWAWRGPDEYPGPLGPLTAWVERQTARVMATHIAAGFELELYEPRDYAALYWYIDYLHGVIDHDSRLLVASRPTPAAVEAAAKAAAAAPARAKKGGPAGKAPKGLAAPKGLGGGSSGGGSGGGGGSSGDGGAAGGGASVAAVRAGHAADHAQAAHSSALRHLCQGLMHMLVGLTEAGVQALPPLPFNSAAERYEQRFGSFHILTRPEPLAYSHFEAATAMVGAQPSAVLTAAGAALSQKAWCQEWGRVQDKKLPRPVRAFAWLLAHAALPCGGAKVAPFPADGEGLAERVCCSNAACRAPPPPAPDGASG
ncbi:hypothetical protein Rsub_02975, partial [Raphidocelis subcapitata]